MRKTKPQEESLGGPSIHPSPLMLIFWHPLLDLHPGGRFPVPVRVGGNMRLDPLDDNCAFLEDLVVVSLVAVTFGCPVFKHQCCVRVSAQ